jgi:uncharacterized protein
MKFSIEAPHPNTIKAYGPGTIKIGSRVYQQALIIGPSAIIDDWSPQTPEELQADHIERFLALEPEIVILGTGARLCFPSPEITRSLMAAGVGLEVMDTASACRTYNVLLGEDRRVIAGLMMIPS